LKNPIKYDLENVDVMNIIKQIHDDLRVRGYDIDELKRLPECMNGNFRKNQGLLSNRLEENISAMSRSHFIQYWWDMPKEEQLKLKIKCAIKKITRKCSYFYFKRVFDQQNIFNASISRCIHDLAEYCNQLETEKNDLTQKLDAVQIELNEIKVHVEKIGN